METITPRYELLITDLVSGVTEDTGVVAGAVQMFMYIIQASLVDECIIMEHMWKYPMVRSTDSLLQVEICITTMWAAICMVTSPPDIQHPMVGEQK